MLRFQKFQFPPPYEGPVGHGTLSLPYPGPESPAALNPRYQTTKQGWGGPPELMFEHKPKEG